MTALQEHQAVLLELLRELDRVCTAHNIPYVLFAGTALGAARHRGFIPWDDDLDVALLRPDYERLLALDDGCWGEKYFLQREFSPHWPLHFSKLRKNGTTCLEKYRPKDERSHRGIYIDVFPLDNAAPTAAGRLWQFAASRVVLAKSLWERGYETDSAMKKLFMTLCRPLPIGPFLRAVKRPGAGDSRCVHSFLGGTSRCRKGVFPRAWFTRRKTADFAGFRAPVSQENEALLTALYGDYMRPPTAQERSKKRHAMLVDTRRDYREYAGRQETLPITEFTRNIR